MTQTSLPPGTGVTTDPPPSAFLTGSALISRVASGAGGGVGPLNPPGHYAPGIHSLSIGL